MTVLCIKTDLETNSIPTWDEGGKEGQEKGQAGQGEARGGRKDKETEVGWTSRAKKEKGEGKKRRMLLQSGCGETKRIKRLSRKHEDLTLNPQWPWKDLRHTTVISAL